MPLPDVLERLLTAPGPLGYERPGTPGVQHQRELLAVRRTAARPRHGPADLPRRAKALRRTANHGHRKAPLASQASGGHPSPGPGAASEIPSGTTVPLPRINPTRAAFQFGECDSLTVLSGRESHSPKIKTNLGRLPAQDQHAGGGEHAAVAEDDADLRVTGLGGGLAAQLADAFGDGEPSRPPTFIQRCSARAVRAVG